MPLTGPGQLEELLQELEKAFGPWEAVEMETVYYDTPDQALAARHWTLRVRQENGRPVLTVKPQVLAGHGGMGAARRGTGRPVQIADAGRAMGSHVFAAGPLLPRCGARFRRLRLLACLPDAVAELALDQGVLTGGGRDLPFGSWRQSERGAAARPWPSGAGVCLKPGISRKRPEQIRPRRLSDQNIGGFMAKLDTLFSRYDKLVIFDTETTGLSPNRDEIIEFSAAVLERQNGEAVVTREYDNLVALSPGRFVPPKIQALTGITNQDLRERGIPKPRLCRDVAELIAGERTLAPCLQRPL